MFGLEGVVEGISQVSPPSSRAAFLVDMREELTPATSLAPGDRLEPVHLHGVQDTSVHLVLPPDCGAEFVRWGWAEPHQYADFDTEFMINGPRDDHELTGIVSIIEERLAFARAGRATARPPSTPS